MGHSNLPYTDPWAVLGLPPNASREEVKAAFRKAALETHPDADPSPRAAARFADIKAAADVLLKGVSSCVQRGLWLMGGPGGMPSALTLPALEADGSLCADRRLPPLLAMPCSRTSSRQQPGTREQQPALAGGQHPQRGLTAPRRCGPRPAWPAARRLGTAHPGHPTPSGGLHGLVQGQGPPAGRQGQG